MASIILKWNSISNNGLCIANDDKLFLSNVKSEEKLAWTLDISRKEICYNVVKP